MLLSRLVFLGNVLLLNCYLLFPLFYKIFVRSRQRTAMSFWHFSWEYIWVDDSRCQE